MESGPVFTDSSGRRRRVLRYAGLAVAVALAVCLGAVAVAMTGGPQAPFTQAAAGAYALRIDGERLRALWVLPFQQLVYRQLMYLVTIQSVMTALLGTRQRWQAIRRTGVFAEPRDERAVTMSDV